MDNIEINILRHAQSLRQVLKRGDWDTSLSDIGKEQANHTAKWLSDNMEWSGLRTSPLKRSQETTNIIAGKLGIPVVIDHLLAEADFHISDDLPFCTNPFDPLSSPAMSDRYLQLKSQAKKALQVLFELASTSDDKILTVSHGGLIKTMLRLIVNNDNVNFKISNMGLTKLQWHSGRWNLVHLNKLDHIPEHLQT